MRDRLFVDTLLESYRNESFISDEEERIISQKTHDLFARRRNDANEDKLAYDQEFEHIINQHIKPYLFKYRKYLLQKTNAIEDEGEVLKEGDNKLLNVRIYNTFKDEI